LLSASATHSSSTTSLLSPSSPSIGHCFFPASQTAHGLLYSLAPFGIGFLTRPLGAVVIGIYADRMGRKPAMVLSFGLMGAQPFARFKLTKE